MREGVWFAPVVRLKRSGRYAFLLAWKPTSMASGTDTSRGSSASKSWSGVDVWMRAEDLEQVRDQDYRRVPRRFDDDSPF